MIKNGNYKGYDYTVEIVNSGGSICPCYNMRVIVMFTMPKSNPISIDAPVTDNIQNIDTDEILPNLDSMISDLENKTNEEYMDIIPIRY